MKQFRTLSVSILKTTITSVKHNSLVIGGNSQNNTIDFGTDDVILFDTDNTERMRGTPGVDVTDTYCINKCIQLVVTLLYKVQLQHLKQQIL